MMTGVKRSFGDLDLDPDYQDVTEFQQKRQKLLESDGKYLCLWQLCNIKPIVTISLREVGFRLIMGQMIISTYPVRLEKEKDTQWFFDVADLNFLQNSNKMKRDSPDFLRSDRWP